MSALTMTPSIKRIEAFRILAGEKELYSGTVVGYKKIAGFEPVVTKTVTIEITDSRIAPTLAFLGIY